MGVCGGKKMLDFTRKGFLYPFSGHLEVTWCHKHLRFLPVLGHRSCTAAT